MEKQEQRKTRLVEKRDTYCAVRSVPPTSGASELAGRGQLEVADVIVGPGALGTDQWSAPELPGRSEAASADRSEISLLWVHRRWLEVGVMMYYPLD